MICYSMLLHKYKQIEALDIYLGLLVYSQGKFNTLKSLYLKFRSYQAEIVISQIIRK